MNIIELSSIQDPALMKTEVAQLAHKRKCSEDDIWELINNYRRTHEGKRSNVPNNIGDTLQKILSKVTITNKSANDILFDELVSLNILVSANVEIGKYKVSFVINNLIIEIDKRKHILSPDEQDNDFKRQLYLIKKGYTVIKLKANEVSTNVERCVDKIMRLL